ncbi:unnamed protein product [Urochloa humidicola]
MEIGSSDVRLIFDIFSPSNPRWRSSLSHCWRSNRGKGSGIGGVRELKGSSRVLVVEELRKPKLQRFLRGECLGFRTKIMPFLRQPPMRFGGSITGSIVDSEQPMILVLNNSRFCSMTISITSSTISITNSNCTMTGNCTMNGNKFIRRHHICHKTSVVKYWRSAIRWISI